MCFSVSLICLCFCAVAALGSNRARARSAENNAPENPRRVGMAFSLRMSGIAYSFIASDWRNVSIHCCASFRGAGSQWEQTHRRRGTPMDRWLLPQYQSHAQQERDLEREGRGFGVHVRLSDVDELEISRSSPVDTGGPSRGGGAGA